MHIDELERRFAASWRAHAPASDRPTVVAVSGGGDSCALLALLCETGVIVRGHIVVAYFDHRLRGDAASQQDLRAVQTLCRRYGLRLETEAWSAPVATEAAAREARYAYLSAVARRHDAVAVVTGHTADDQVETVLLHALRGAGLYGLAGIAPVAPWPFVAHDGPALVRPLLALTRTDLRAYSASRAISYVDDASNEDGSFLRNRLRRELLPAIDAAAPGARRAILRIADEAREGVAAVAAAVDGLINAADFGTVRMSRDAVRSLPPDLVPHLYRHAIVRLLGDAREFERRHYAVLARAHGARTGATFHLPRGIVATVDAGAVILSLGALATVRIGSDVMHRVPFSGAIGAWQLDVSPAVAGADLRLPGDAVVRARRPGDRIAPRGMGGHKKLQDYYVDRKVPRRDRDAAPVIAVDAEVLWTPFGAVETSGSGEAYGVRAVRIA